MLTGTGLKNRDRPSEMGTVGTHDCVLEATRLEFCFFVQRFKHPSMSKLASHSPQEERVVSDTREMAAIGGASLAIAS